MAKVPITVLQRFGEFNLGNAMIDENRVKFLEERGLAVRGHDSSPQRSEPDVDSSRLDAVATTFSTTMGITREVDEPALDFLERVAASSSQMANPEDSPERKFEAHLRENLGDSVTSELLNAGFRSPDDILDATNEDLDAVKGVGPDKIEKIRAAVDTFEG